MPQIGYRQWGLIPADADPTVSQVYTARPPMMTALAVDRNSSLIFKLARTPPQIQAEIEVTALSGEKCKLPPLQVFSSPDGEHFHPVQVTPWTKSQDGLFLVFRVQIDDPEAYLKFQYTQAHSLIVNKVNFSTL